MGKKILVLLCILAMIASIVVAGVTYSNLKSLEADYAAEQLKGESLSNDLESYQSEIKVLEEQLTQLKEDQTKQEDENKELAVSIERLEELQDYSQENSFYLYDRLSQLRELVMYQSDLLDEHDEAYLSFYGSDKTAENVVRHYYASIPNGSLEEQVSFVAQTLSKYSFNNYPIDVLRIENIEGQRIAFVDLKNPAEDDDGWIVHYFPGSTGGIMTADTLIETFLQRTLAIDWIDGIHFSYEGQMDWITDHDPALCKATYYRDGTAVWDEE